MDLSVLNQDGQHLFSTLHTATTLKHTYLAGGTALAFQLQHRYSFDLDFFAQSLPRLDTWEDEMRHLGSFTLLHTHEQGFVGRINTVQISVTTFTHQLLEKPTLFHNIPIATLSDIAAMKLFALLGRSTRRDVYDLYFLAKHFSLTEMLVLFEHKFESIDVSEPLILKSLANVITIPDEPVDLIQPVTWQDVCMFWQHEVKQYMSDFENTTP